MELKTYLKNLTEDERAQFAVKCDTSFGHLRNCLYGFRTLSPELCAAIERESGGAVTRRELRADWQLIWPELASKPRAKAAA